MNTKIVYLLTLKRTYHNNYDINVPLIFPIGIFDNLEKASNKADNLAFEETKNIIGGTSDIENGIFASVTYYADNEMFEKITDDYYIYKVDIKNNPTHLILLQEY